MRGIPTFLFITSMLVGCGSNDLKPGSGAPLSSLTNMPGATEFVAEFDLATPISGVDLLNPSGVTQPCSGGGTAQTTYHLDVSSLSVRLGANYNHCKVTLSLGGIPYSETIEGTTMVNQSVSKISQNTKVSLSGDLGLAINCEVTQVSGNSVVPTGFCKVFDAEGTKIDIPLDQAALMI